MGQYHTRAGQSTTSLHGPRTTCGYLYMPEQPYLALEGGSQVVRLPSGDLALGLDH